MVIQMNDGKRVKNKKDDIIELPKLKKEYKNKNDKDNYTITLDDIVKLVENHELKKDSNIKKEDLSFVKKEEKTLSTREEKNKKLYENETIKEENKEINEKKLEKSKKEIIKENEKQDNKEEKKKHKKKRLKKGN